MIELPAPT